MKSKGKTKRIVVRIAVMNVVNSVLLVILLWMLTQVNIKALTVKELRNQRIVSQELTDVAVLTAGIEGKSVEIDKLRSVFVDEDNFLLFLNEKDKLQASGVVSSFSVSDETVKDTKGHKGYALLIELKGGSAEVVQAMQSLERMPFLMRIASMDVSVLREEGQLRIKYVGFLYTNE